MAYNTKIKPQNFSGEINEGEVLVESAGYIPAKVQIEQFIDAGLRLSAARKEAYYDVNTENDGEELVLAREPNFDMADASTLLRVANERLKASYEVKKMAQDASSVAKEALSDDKGTQVPEK